MGGDDIVPRGHWLGVMHEWFLESSRAKQIKSALLMLYDAFKEKHIWNLELNSVCSRQCFPQIADF